MISCVKLTIAYIRYYKKQSLVLFCGILMSVILLTGIGSLLYSGQVADREFARASYGDWHFQVMVDGENALSVSEREKVTAAITENKDRGYKIEQMGKASVREKISEPFEINLYSADEAYMEMTGRTLLEGNYPQKEGEIALDYYALHNSELSGNIGDKIVLGGESYTLCGLLADSRSGEDRKLEAYVSGAQAAADTEAFLCLKFDEADAAYTQLLAFLQEHQLSEEAVTSNKELNAYVGGEKKESVPEIIKAAMQLPEGRLVYLLSNLEENVDLTNKMVLAALAFFGVFVIYSLFQVTVVKRLRQYGILRTLGLTEGYIFLSLLLELFLIFAASYPFGCLMGNGIGRVLYQKLGGLFQTSEATDAMQAHFHVAWNVVFYGALFFFCVFVLICVAVEGKGRKYSDIQMIKSQISRRRRNRKIYSMGRRRLTGVLTGRFMFGRLSAFLGIVISLSLGGVIFLATAYVAGSTRADREHKLQTDDNLGADIQVSIDSDDLRHSIPAEAVNRIGEIEGVSLAMPVSYLLGEIPLNDGRLEWTSFFPEIAGEKDYQPDPEIMEKYNGVVTEQGEGNYRLKVNVYGYSDEMIGELEDYVLEGMADAGLLKKDNSVMIKMLMDGQGNYGGVDFGVGDSITLKVPKSGKVSEDVLKFTGDAQDYVEKEFVIAGVVSRPIGRNTSFIGDNGKDNVDIIMSNQQMYDNFGISDYQSVWAQLEQDADSSQVTKSIRSVVSGVSKCVVKDNIVTIAEKNKHLRQRENFFNGIAVIIFGISLLHIMNGMQYLVLSRKHEWGILRAMGITDAGLRKMLIHEGVRYGIYTSITMFVLYEVVYQAVTLIMKQVFLYIITDAMLMPQLCAGMILLNIILCVFAVLYAGRDVLRQDICGLI